MDWVWFLVGFDGRINRAKMWLSLLIILCWMIFVAMLLFGVDRLFGFAVESVRFNVDAIFGIVDPAVLRALFARLRDGHQTSPAHLVIMFLKGVGTLVFVWVYVATSVKRLHDRDKSGWWMLLFFVLPGLYGQFVDRFPHSYFMFPLASAAFILAIWGFVELFCLSGTRWTNRFGPSPLPKVQGRPRSGHGSYSSSSGWDQTDAMDFVPHVASPPAGAHGKRGA